MKKLLFASGLATLLASAAYAQNTNLAFTPGKLVVFRGGDGIITISSGRQHPIFLDEYDPSTTNQIDPMMSMELPTNGPGGIFWNAHAGSEGQAMTRSADRTKIVVAGYCGDLNSIPGTPSSATNSTGQGYDRGFATIDAFTNYDMVYHSDLWYGILPGLTQNNPRGIATDGSNNFWGCGTIAGTQTGGAFVETGTLYSDGGAPEQVQNLVNSAYFMRIINGVLYMVGRNQSGGAQNNGVYNFINFPNLGGAVVPLDYAPGNEAKVLDTNLFLNAGATYGNIITFDMNPAGTIAYIADETYGIIKFVNSGGTWSQAYAFGSNNIGSAVPKHPSGSTGVFGIAVDFGQTNPVIYATTTEEGDGANVCSNRLISIVDTGTAPGTSLVAQTLAVANGINERFAGVDFTPDLTPLITAQPMPLNVTTNEATSLSVGATSAFPLTFQWQYNGTNVADTANISGATSSTLAIKACSVTNAGGYSVIVSNQYGMVTSLVANLFVSTVPQPPSISTGVVYVTNFIGNNQSFSVNPSGTPPFSYQWYAGSAALSDSAASGQKYEGSLDATLNITNLQLSDSGSYYVTVSNASPNGLSNLVAVLTVQFVLPVIPENGEPGSMVALQGQTATLSLSGVEGTLPLSYQWYQGSFADALANANEFSGTETNALTITGISLADQGNYFCVVSNGGGSVTSTVASVTVVVPPAPSYVGYSNQVYTQGFDSLPNPGTVEVNTIGGGGLTTIGGINYDIANPFDFALPLYTNFTAEPSGGLNLATTMPGWYGECDADTAATGSQLGASDGGTTTGGIYSFGQTNSIAASANRALGLISTSTSGGSHFGLKLINETTNNLNFISLKFVGEFWKRGTKPKTMVFGYNVDPAGNSSTLSPAEILAASNNPVAGLNVSFKTAGIVGGTNGLLAVNQTNASVANLPLATAWTPGSALWLVWSIYDATGSGQGYGIDDLYFAASGTNDISVAPPITAPVLSGVSYNSTNGLSFGFANAPGSSSQFTVWATTNLATPFNQWVNLGNPTEVEFGNYQFVDSQATNATGQRFYCITTP